MVAVMRDGKRCRWSSFDRCVSLTLSFFFFFALAISSPLRPTLRVTAFALFAVNLEPHISNLLFFFFVVVLFLFPHRTCFACLLFVPRW